MNNFDEELLKVAKLPFNEILKDFKIIMLSNKLLYISNFLKVLEYSNEKIVIKVKKSQKVQIEGAGLIICQINKGELMIKGEINICNLGDNNETK